MFIESVVFVLIIDDVAEFEGFAQILSYRSILLCFGNLLLRWECVLLFLRTLLFRWSRTRSLLTFNIFQALPAFRLSREHLQLILINASNKSFLLFTHLQRRDSVCSLAILTFLTKQSRFRVLRQNSIRTLTQWTQHILIYIILSNYAYIS